jgi:hypothetical protein
MLIAEIIFAVAFVGMISLCMFGFAFGIVHFVVLAVRMFKPNFAVLQRPGTVKQENETPAKVKLLTIDFLMAERRRVMQEATRAQHERLNPQMFSKLVRTGAAKQQMEWTLSELTAQLNRRRGRLEERRDKWAIAIFPHGLKCPYWLIDFTTKGKRREPVYAPLRDKRRTFDLASAQRWCESLEGSPMILAANAQARIQIRLRQAATKLWEQRQTAEAVQENTNATA